MNDDNLPVGYRTADLHDEISEDIGDTISKAVVKAGKMVLTGFFYGAGLWLSCWAAYSLYCWAN